MISAGKNHECPKCGYIRIVGDIECPKCGIVYEKYEKLQAQKQAEIAAKQDQSKKQEFEKRERQVQEKKIQEKELIQKRQNKIKGSTNPLLKIITALVMIIILFTGGFYLYTKDKHHKKYVADLNVAHSLMTLSAIKCIEMSEKYSNVWSEAINDRHNKDFNDDIMMQKVKFTKYGDIKEINKSKDSVEKVLHELNQPKILYPEAHKKLVALYGVYSQLHSLAISPSGSLISYNQKVNDLQSEYIKIINELKVLLPKEK